MTSLTKPQRNELARTVLAARSLAEEAAGKALHTLGVDESDAPGHLDNDGRHLRIRLRAQARQLGDRDDRRKQGCYEIRHLTEKIAYDHWHRLLFARFLAENDLLISPDHGVGISLDYCGDLAPEMGLRDGWEVAANFAARMLPQIFRADDPAGNVVFAPEDRVSLRKLVTDLPRDIFLADDSLGWVYQFWQAQRKDEVNKSGEKIGADEIAPVTQLFTEDYMVLFLLHNTLGAWWAGKVAGASSSGLLTGKTEPDCRAACALPGVNWEYLRFVKVAGTTRSERPEPEQDAPATIAPDWETLAIRQGDNLPHWTCERAIYHVCFRLVDSIPQARLDEWNRERDDVVATAQQFGRDLTEDEEQRLRHLYSDKIEAYLDAGHGACWLARPEIANLVANALRHFDGTRYRLHAWCAMPNHVHVIVEPLPGHELSKIAHSWKSFTANVANKTLGRTGQFWQHEPYDHIIRNEREYRFQVDYTWKNPERGRVEAPRWKVAGASSSGSPPDAVAKEPEQDAPATIWLPAAGNFAGWPKTAKELRLLDPCMGSGHFVAAELPILVAMRMAEEGLSVAKACEAVLRDNLFGLEIDPRCTQIAAFNVALAAWKLVGQYRQLPPLNLACCGLGINARKEDWVKLAGDNARLRGGMEQLFDLFQKAPELGSLINPRRISGDLLVAEFHELQPLLEQALAREETKRDETLAEMGVTARGLTHAAEILAGKFTLVATNVPYLGRGKQNDVLKDFCERYHPDAKADLATCFVERYLDLCAAGGSTALVTPQNWLFLGTYEDMRRRLLRSAQWEIIARLGANGFQTPMWDFNVMLIAITRSTAHATHNFSGIDVADEPSPEAKGTSLEAQTLASWRQIEQLENPDARVVLTPRSRTALLEKLADAYIGLHVGDWERYRRGFWEVAFLGTDWRTLQNAVTDNSPYAGLDDIIYWPDSGKMHRDNPAARVQGKPAWGKRGVGISLMAQLPGCIYDGGLFRNGVAVISPHSSEHLPAIWAFCSSPEFNAAVREIDQKLYVTCGTLVKIPFDLAHWQKVAAEKYPNGLPKPHSDDPTQWLFNGHPKGATAPLQVAVARLLGYRWPRQTGSSFPDCPALKADGLEKFADADGIVCLNAIKGEQPAAERLRALLAAANVAGASSSGDPASPEQDAPATIPNLLRSVGYADKTFDDWLRNGFFEQHCQLFHQRPFIWQVWDGLRDGFSVLVNYHRLCGGRSFQLRQEQAQEPEQDAPATSGRRVLEKLIYTYLGDWIARQKAAVAAGEEGSDAKLAAAQELKVALEKILEGEGDPDKNRGYDIFVRWKPLEKQPIGWDPDLNDGVRLNIRPFVEAGILRRTPKINWRKDRGKDVPSAPWFKVFKGDRINDHHLTLAEKRKAREP